MSEITLKTLSIVLGSATFGAVIAVLIKHFLNRGIIKAETDFFKANVKKLQLETEEIKHQSKTLIEEVKKLYYPGKYYDDFREAFIALDNCIEEYIKDTSRNNNGQVIVPLRLLAVAMTFSWDNFICLSIPKLLAKYPDIKVQLELIFVNPDYLKQFTLSKHETNWVKESKERKNDVRKFCENYKDKFKGRLLFTAKMYNNLPHWHGWLVGKNHLFLGRTKWFYDNKLPRLSVGQNEYRYFNSENSEGKERIDLYESWFEFYYSHHSELAASNFK